MERDQLSAGPGGKGGRLERVVFAGGCFWCMVSPFDKLKGVKSVVSGYTGGHTENPTYEEVSSGETGHFEAVEIMYDPEEISYQQLLNVFWRQIDPADAGGQFVDRGPQYRTAIFYTTQKQKEMAEQSKAEIERSGRFKRHVVTEVLAAGKFYRAEEYHQDYYSKNPARYGFYYSGSGRDRLAGKKGLYMEKSDEELRKKLTPLQYKVTRECGTEPPFMNEFWANKREGIYVDIVSGEPLFSSTDKYDSGTGWPSFTRPIAPENIIEKTEEGPMARTEVKSRHGDSHLGHVFPDGPAPAGLRYCMNSAALRFIPKEELEKEGYGQYTKLFEKAAAKKP